MATLQLGFKAFDIHELLCHFMATHSGLYARQQLRVSLLDTTFLADDQLALDTCQVACGAALTGWLKGAAIKVVAVATDRPMFWLYGRTGIDNLTALQGKRVTGFPGFTPPAQFLNIILRQAGLDPARDVTMLAARDDNARLGLLSAGDVDAAVISSAIPPAVMARSGFTPLVFFGDRIRVPSTGLAVSQALLERNAAAVQALVTAHVEALTLIHRDDDRLRTVLAQYFRIEPAALDPTCELVRGCFTTDGRSAPTVTGPAIEMMAAVLAVAEPRSRDALYDFAWLPGP